MWMDLILALAVLVPLLGTRRDGKGRIPSGTE